MRKNIVLSAYNRATYLDQTQAIMYSQVSNRRSPLQSDFQPIFNASSAIFLQYKTCKQKKT